MTRDVLLFHHTHTPDSNRFEREVRGLPIDSHTTDYVELASRLPDGQDAVFVKTDHWKTSPKYFDRLASRLDSRDSELTRHDAHVYFELTGSRVAIINGVEAAVARQRNHVTICGVPLETRETYTTLDLQGLEDVAADAAWIAPAHVGMPFHHISPSLMEAICELAAAPNVEVALGYTTGYFPLYNRIARNEIPARTSVGAHAEAFDLSLLPELDLHTAVPEGFSGCGVVQNSVIDALRDGHLPVSDILRADLFRPTGCHSGITVRQFLHNYAVFVPLLEGTADPHRLFERSLPETEWLRTLDVPANTVPLP
jgi:hypothetical protein